MSQEKTLEILSDFANALEAAAVNVKHQIAELQAAKGESRGSAGPGKAYDIQRIRWESASGDKGPFEKSSDTNSQDFQALLKDTQAHKGKMTVSGWFVWLFQDGVTLGRKKRSF